MPKTLIVRSEVKRSVTSATDVPGQKTESDESSEGNESTCGASEWSETNLATNPNGGKAASGPRVKTDKDGVSARR